MNAGRSTPALEPIRRVEGPNGVTAEVFDHTAPYGYADVFHVKLRVVAHVPGAPRPYERTLERMGVSADRLDRVRAELVEGFLARVLPYLGSSAFPERFRHHLERARPARARFRGARR
ncbi:MAG: hypothetical protein Kow0092_17410 [Deferrisomatales bacterium]